MRDVLTYDPHSNRNAGSVFTLRRSTLRVGRSTFNVRHSSPAFTILEILVTLAVLSIFALMLTGVVDSSFKLWRRTASDIAMFDAARAAFDTMTRRLSQATLSTYLDYYSAGWQRRNPGDPAFTPENYGRASDLHFLSGPAADILGGSQQGHGVFCFAPLGFTDSNPNYTDLPNLLNPLGYYIEWGSDASLRPNFLSTLPAKHRFRLIENILPSQNFVNYPEFTDTNKTNDDAWITSSGGLSGANAVKHALADNIIALIIRPEVTEKDAEELGFTGNPKGAGLTRDYFYDSRAGEQRTTTPEDIQFAQLPPLLRVIMVAVSEKDANNLIGTSPSPPAEFQLNPSWFTNPQNLDADLKALSDKLIAANIQFRIFNQVIPLRSAKFSAQRETD